MVESEDGDAGSPPFTLSTIVIKVVVYDPAERADTSYFYSTPICTLWLQRCSAGTVHHSVHRFSPEFIQLRD